MKITPRLRDTLLTILGVIALASVMLVDVSIEPPKAPEPFYNVVNTVEGLPMYLAFVNVGKGMAVDIRQQWTVDEKQAWRFGTRDSAQRGADQYGGVPVPVRRTKTSP